MTQEFHISVTPLGSDEYLVRTERVAPGVPLAEEQFVWPVENWLTQARQLMNDPLMGLLQGFSPPRVGGFELPHSESGSAGANGETSLPPVTLVDLGQELYSALFQGALRDSWMTAQGIAQHRGEMLRLRLGLKGLRLPRLPWEVMYGVDGNGERSRYREGLGPLPRALATGTNIIFSRYQPSNGLLTGSVPPPMENGQSLRILMAIAAPSDQERLELMREAIHLQQELRSNGAGEGITDIQLTLLDQPDREQLTQALEQGQFQVFHFAGHSNLGADGGDLYLVNSRTGLTEPLSGDDLAGLLVNNGVRMAVFNSCRGAHNASADPDVVQEERNLAEALVGRGIPGVLAMAERIPDDVALTLTRLFYRNLKLGYPIDLSVNRARQGLISAYGSHQLYWALPILYMNPEFDGYLMAGDRTYDNPADRLSVLPPAAEPIPVLSGEQGDRVMAVSEAYPLDSPDDLAMITQAVLGEDDFIDLVNDFDHYLPALELDEEALEDDHSTYEQDAAMVADLIQQLSDTSSDLPLISDSSDPFLPDITSELERYRYTPNPIVMPIHATLESEEPEKSEESEAEIGIEEESLAATPTAAAVTTTASANREVTSSESSYRSPALPSWVANCYLLLPLVGAVGAIAIAIVGLQLFPDLMARRSTNEGSPAITDTQIGAGMLDVGREGLEVADTNRVAAIATANFGRNDLSKGKEAVDVLLDRGTISAAEAALSAVPTEQLNNPEISFLRGRLAWEALKQGNLDFSPDDVRRYWVLAVQKAGDVPAYYTALGFAYHAEEKYQEAIESFCKSLSLMYEQKLFTRGDRGDRNCPLPDRAIRVENSNVLTPIAGLALSLNQGGIRTENQEALRQAIVLQELVLKNDPVRFQATQLAVNNWLWTEETIQEWRSLLQRNQFLPNGLRP